VRFFTEIRRLAFLRPPLGDLGATYEDHHRLIEKRVVYFLLALIELFFARCYGWGARAFINSKWANLLQREPIDPKFPVQGVVPHQSFFFSVNKAKWSYVRYKNLDRSSTVLSQFTRVPDRRTDGRNSHR